ncbi:hypothetical protein DRQ25_09115 [Candidatus Fermentibacteria bacterium]|nr:MAG: hypothetical protein DRQ25_09115 [Candidatus Fermentibacteria bacterium]
MRVGYVNQVFTNSISSNSLTPGFPAINIQDPRMSRKWQALATGINYVDVGTVAITASMACINAHNAVSGDTLKLEGYSDSGRTSLSVSHTFTLIEYGTAIVFTEATLYWRFAFNTVPIIEVGGLFLGDNLILPSYEIGHSFSEVANDDFYISDTQQLYGINKSNYRKASYLLPITTWDEKDEITTFWKAMGRSTAFYLLQYPDRQDLRRLFYCRLLNEELLWQEHEKNIQLYKDLVINIQEVF